MDATLRFHCIPWSFHEKRDCIRLSRPKKEYQLLDRTDVVPSDFHSLALLMWSYWWLIQPHSEEWISFQKCPFYTWTIMLLAWILCVCVCAHAHMSVCLQLFLVFTATAGVGIITYCVTLYLAALCLIKEIEKQLWRLWHYLLCLVTQASLIWCVAAVGFWTQVSKVLTACVINMCATSSVAHQIVPFLSFLLPCLFEDIFPAFFRLKGSFWFGRVRINLALLKMC